MEVFYILVGKRIVPSVKEMDQTLDALLVFFFGLCYLLDFHYPYQYEASLAVLHYYIFGDRSIPGGMLEGFNVILQDYSMFKTG